MNIDQKALENGSVGCINDSPTYRTHDRTSTKKIKNVNCCEKDNPPSMVEHIDEGIKSSEGLENVSDGIQSLKTAGSDDVGDDNSVHQDVTLTLQVIKKEIGI